LIELRHPYAAELSFYVVETEFSRVLPYFDPVAAEGILKCQEPGDHGERGARAYNGGLGAEPPAGSRGRAPGQEVRGRSPLKPKAFQLLDVQRKRQICLILVGTASFHRSKFYPEGTPVWALGGPKRQIFGDYEIDGHSLKQTSYYFQYKAHLSCYMYRHHVVTKNVKAFRELGKRFVDVVFITVQTAPSQTHCTVARKALRQNRSLA